MFILTFLFLVLLGGAKSHIQAQIQNMKDKRRKSNTRNTKSKKQNIEDKIQKTKVTSATKKNKEKGMLIGAIKVLVVLFFLPKIKHEKQTELGLNVSAHYKTPRTSKHERQKTKVKHTKHKSQNTKHRRKKIKRRKSQA